MARPHRGGTPDLDGAAVQKWSDGSPRRRTSGDRYVRDRLHRWRWSDDVDRPRQLVLGEFGARLTVLAADGEEYSEFWLRADLAEQRLEYLYYSDNDGAIVRGFEWPIDLSEGLWDTGDESTLRDAFNEAAEVAAELCICRLKAGADIVTLGGRIDQETLDEAAPLWSPVSTASE